MLKVVGVGIRLHQRDEKVHKAARAALAREEDEVGDEVACRLSFCGNLDGGNYCELE